MVRHSDKHRNREAIHCRVTIESHDRGSPPHGTWNRDSSYLARLASDMFTVWHKHLNKLEATDLRLDVHDSDRGYKAAKDASSRQA